MTDTKLSTQVLESESRAIPDAPANANEDLGIGGVAAERAASSRFVNADENDLCSVRRPQIGRAHV